VLGENFDREAAWWRSRCTMPSRMSVTGTLLRAAGSSDPVKLSLGSSVPDPTEAVGRLALVAPTLRSSPHRQMGKLPLNSTRPT
jgi:hypothetical protein